MHELMAATLDKVIGEIHRFKRRASLEGVTERPRWPMIVLRTPKGWTCPKEVDGKRVEDYWRAPKCRSTRCKPTRLTCAFWKNG